MGKKAREIENRILSELPPNKRLFKINAGRGWQGQTVKHDKNILILKNPRPVYAAPEGWPDLCGWETVTITQEMVGQKIPVFCMEEVKAGNDTLKPAQKKMRDLFEKMGGVFKVVKG
jgi:hypothetical protein